MFSCGLYPYMPYTEMLKKSGIKCGIKYEFDNFWDNFKGYEEVWQKWAEAEG